MSPAIIVTGGAGFIGSNLVAALNARGCEDILVVDRLGTGAKWRNLNGLVFADYEDNAVFRRRVVAGGLPPETRTVFHLGACSATTEADADYLMDNNYGYTRDVCRAALARGARFIYASSAATYGAGEHGYQDAPLEGLTRLRPLNMYGLSKQLFDRHALGAGWFDRIVGLKYFNVYGPGEAHKGEMRSMVHKAWGQMRSTGRLGLFKSYRPDIPDGEQTRDFLYVRDAVAITLFFMETPGPAGLFNVGSGQARSWNDLAHAVSTAMNLPPQIEYLEMPATLRGQYQYHTQADLTHLRAAGYHAPITPLEDGIRDYLQNHLPRPQNNACQRNGPGAV
ncbi:MAG: ADP-glyceromanno-heptose 6-epimerase [Candidatus Marinimicrobia bacterium]|nr:ADP-glyceromanno-heptose 6-epimerase [Candidatus Neomarinimicrobiota bacterium]